MSIVVTEIESIHGSAEGQRLIFYRCQDSQGVWHGYGPVITSDPSFDAEVYKSVVAVRVSDSLASAELQQLTSG